MHALLEAITMTFVFYCLALFAIGFLVKELALRLCRKKEINVVIKHKDGSTTLTTVRVGRDKEVDALIRAATRAIRKSPLY